MLSGRPPGEVAAAIGGGGAREFEKSLLNALRAVAAETSAAIPSERFAAGGDIFAGKILEARPDELVIELPTGARVLVPRWLGQAANRERVGDALALIADRLDRTQVVVQALPALEMTRAASPFGRSAPVKDLSAADARLLSRLPVPLKVLLPVSIHEPR